jgi:hypothetical protein
MKNFEALQEVVKATLTARDGLNSRIAENKANWDKTSNLVKDVWGGLSLPPRSFKIGNAAFTCGPAGITNEKQYDGLRTPVVLEELQLAVKEFLERTRDSFNERLRQ